MNLLGAIQTMTERVFREIGFDLVRRGDPVRYFHSNHYLRHNARRLEHLASLGIPVSGMSVLEVGAGIGDHTHYYLDRGCGVTITEAREENLVCLRSRYPENRIRFLDMESPSSLEDSPFDVVHCYGLLYHLRRPEEALAFLGQSTREMLFLETCVSFDGREGVNLTAEPQSIPTQAYSGTGCRPSRSWLFARLQGLFEHVYLPKTQPCHEEFPLDWTAPEKHKPALQRAIFVASRRRLDNDTLTTSLLLQQTRHA